MEALEHLGSEVNHLLAQLNSTTLYGQPIATPDYVLTNYLFFMFIAIGILGAVMYIGVRGLRLVPEKRVSSIVESLAEYVRGNVAVELLGSKDGRAYFPFIATIFFFILINNLVGLVPGCKPGTGSMGVTVALSTTVFIYFNMVGVKKQGAWGYMKSFVPHGVPFPINLVVALIEVFSAVLRIFTLAVRLFANMYAGHIILGIFALLTSLFLQEFINDPSLATLAASWPSLGWLTLMTALYMLEVLVAFVQAYVFTMLTAVYISLAAHPH